MAVKPVHGQTEPPMTLTPSQYLPPTDQALRFDPSTYLLNRQQAIADEVGEESLDLLSHPEGRMTLAYDDPLAFALIYLPHHLQDDKESISFADAHFEWADKAKGWMTKTPTRDAYVAPRSLGKSTWWFLILPMWAAAFGHVKFIAAFADSAQQAQTHLSTFRGELNNNDLLREDFPSLTNPAKRNGRAIADNEWKYKADSGFIFVGKGIDSSSLGLKDGNLRPDLIIGDDLEPDEANYSQAQKDKRLGTLLEAVLYLNVSARVVLCGTVTMTGSIVHDLIRSLDQEPEQWVSDLRPPIDVHHVVPIAEDDEGNERSTWPGNDKFGLAYMNSIRGTTAFAKNYMNRPIAGDGNYWTPTSFTWDASVEPGGLLLSVDPAVTTKASSDFTGLALVGWSSHAKKLVVVNAWQVKLGPDALRQRVMDICEQYPVLRVLVETNQGGMVWKSILHDLPVPLSTVHQSDKKEVRAARVFTKYDQGHVIHSKKIPLLEEQMCSFPKVLHDDMVDAVCSGLAFLLNGMNAKRSGVINRPTQGSYLH